jgi:hypothetical protein
MEHKPRKKKREQTKKGKKEKCKKEEHILLCGLMTWI